MRKKDGIDDDVENFINPMADGQAQDTKKTLCSTKQENLFLGIKFDNAKPTR